MFILERRSRFTSVHIPVIFHGRFVVRGSHSFELELVFWGMWNCSRRWGKTARFQSEILWVSSNQSWDLLVQVAYQIFGEVVASHKLDGFHGILNAYLYMLGSSFGSCRPAFAPSQSSWEEPWRAAPTCWCWLWWHAPPTCCCPVRASLLPRCCVAARSTRLEPWHRPPLSRLRAVLCRWAWPRQVANPRGFLWSSLASWRAPRLLASWLSSSMAPTLVPAAVCESWIFCLIQLEELENRNTQNGPQSREQKQLRSVAVCGKGELHISPDPRDLLLIFHPTLNIHPVWLQLFVDAWLNHQISNVGPLLPKKRGYEKTIDISEFLQEEKDPISPNMFCQTRWLELCMWPCQSP